MWKFTLGVMLVTAVIDSVNQAVSKNSMNQRIKYNDLEATRRRNREEIRQNSPWLAHRYDTTIDGPIKRWNEQVMKTHEESPLASWIHSLFD